MEKWDKLVFGVKIAYVAMSIALFVIAIMIVLMVYGFPIITPTKDVSNVTVLISGSGIALFISLTILMYSNEQGKESSKIVYDIKNMVVDQKQIMENQVRILKDQEEFTTKKRNSALILLHYHMSRLKRSTDLLESELYKLNEGEITKNQYMEEIKKKIPSVKINVSDLVEYCDDNRQYIDEAIISDIHKLEIEGNRYYEMWQQSRDFFDPTRVFPELIDRVWDKIPDEKMTFTL